MRTGFRTRAAAIFSAITLAGCGPVWVTDHATGRVYETTNGDLIDEAIEYYSSDADFTDAETGKPVHLERGFSVHNRDPGTER